MRDHKVFDKIDLHLIRILYTVLTERSVSKAAVRLGVHQPVVGSAPKRLRDLAGDPLLVRPGSLMVPTAWPSARKPSTLQILAMVASSLLVLVTYCERFVAATLKQH